VKVVCIVPKTRNKAVAWFEMFANWDSADIAGNHPVDVVAADVGAA
jgi:hypothetical protein